MGELITADQLGVGDIWYDPQRPHRGARVVLTIRTMRSTETYRVVGFQTLPDLRAGQLDLRHDHQIVRLQRRLPEELANLIQDIEPFGHLVIYRLENQIWA